MKRILITHDDLDGAGCDNLFRQRYPDIEIQFHDYDRRNIEGTMGQ